EPLDEAAVDALDVGVVAGRLRGGPPQRPPGGGARGRTPPRRRAPAPGGAGWAPSTPAPWLAPWAMARSSGPGAAYTSASRCSDSRPSASGSPLPRSQPGLISHRSPLRSRLVG